MIDSVAKQSEISFEGILRKYFRKGGGEAAGGAHGGSFGTKQTKPYALLQHVSVHRHNERALVYFIG